MLLACIFLLSGWKLVSYYAEGQKNQQTYKELQALRQCNGLRPHRMNDLSMFGHLGGYEKKSFWENHQYLYFDKLLTLSTCEYGQENGRLVVVAKRID